MTPRTLRTPFPGRTTVLPLLLLTGAFLVSCDGDPAAPGAERVPTSLALSASFPAGVSGDDEDAYQAVDGLRIRLTSDDEVLVEELLPFDPGASETRVRVELELEEEVLVLVEAELRRGADPLFRGDANLTLAPGSTEQADLELRAVPAGIQTDGPLGPLFSVGETVELRGAVLFATGDTAVSLSLDWTSLDPQVAEVVTSGGTALARAVGDGEARIQASHGSFQETVTVTVELQVATVEVDPPSSEISVGETVQLQASARDALGNVLGGRTATWSTSNAAVATVDANGLVEGVRAGEVQITAAVEEVEGTAAVRVVASAPDVETTPALNVGHRRAQLRALVNPNGAPTTARFEWGTEPDLSDAVGTDPVSLGSAAVEQTFSTTVTGLAPGTRHYFRVLATNDVGTAQGQILAFDTPDPQPPSVETLPATGIGTNSATLEGSVNPNGAATDAWFEWADNPSLDGFQTSPVAAGNGSVDVEVDADLDDIAAEDTYYFRVAASNAQGTSRGEILSFRTRIPPPSDLNGGFDGPTAFMSFQDNSTTDTFFRVERSGESPTSGFEVIEIISDDTADFDSEFFEDSGPFPVGSAYYRVFACNANECSGPSDVFELVVPPPSLGGTVEVCGEGCSDLSGVEVTLTGPVNRTDVTSSFGFYQFTDLPLGTYTVSVNEEIDVCPDFRIVFDPSSVEVTLDSGAEFVDVDFTAFFASCAGPE